MKEEPTENKSSILPMFNKKKEMSNCSQHRHGELCLILLLLLAVVMYAFIIVPLANYWLVQQLATERVKSVALKYVMYEAASAYKFESALDSLSEAAVTRTVEAAWQQTPWYIVLGPFVRESAADIDVAKIVHQLRHEVYGKARPKREESAEEEEEKVDVEAKAGAGQLAVVEDSRRQDEDESFEESVRLASGEEREMLRLEVNTEAWPEAGEATEDLDWGRYKDDLYGSLKHLLPARPSGGGGQDGAMLQRIQSELNKNEKMLSNLAGVLYRLQDKLETLSGLNDIKVGVTSIKENMGLLVNKYKTDEKVTGSKN